MAQLFADENFPRPVVELLRSLGHDVLTTEGAGLGGRGVSDAAIIQAATNVGRIVVTLNRRDFVRLHLGGAEHAGIVVCTVNPDAAGLARAISAAIATAGDCRSRLLRVNRPGPGVTSESS